MRDKLIRTRWPLAALALIAMVAIVTACGSNAPTGTTSSANGTSATSSNDRGGNTGAASTSRNTGATSISAHTQAPTKREMAVKFAECVRAHGVPHFPDPDATGNFNFGVDVSAATFTAAVNACKALQPPGTLSAHRSMRQQSAALRFAACVRAHGVPDFPDPVNGQPLIDTTKIPSSNQPGGMTILNAATHKCGSVLGPDARGGSGA